MTAEGRITRPAKTPTTSAGPQLVREARADWGLLTVLASERKQFLKTWSGVRTGFAALLLKDDLVPADNHTSKGQGFKGPSSKPSGELFAGCCYCLSWSEPDPLQVFVSLRKSVKKDFGLVPYKVPDTIGIPDQADISYMEL